MVYLAHSAGVERPSQSYHDHVEGVYNRARQYAEEVEKYSVKAKGLFVPVVCNSALYHDLGKLDIQNQQALQKIQGYSHLPLNHVDAGVAKLIRDNDYYSALNVYAHHRGLPNFAAEYCRNENVFRTDIIEDKSYIDKNLNMYLEKHNSVVSVSCQYKLVMQECAGDIPIFCRLSLSCLIDADHSDTAAHYRKLKELSFPLLRAKERLARLDNYREKISSMSDRDKLRNKMYISCCNSISANNIVICDAPVGSGKTMAVTAYMLKQALKYGARRIFIVQPYTNIITQTVDFLRRALVLDGENPTDVVAELHSRAEFESANFRYLNGQWRAPIIVTTAVAFFETLAANKPSALRKLHEIPGSIIFVDEAHDSVPLKLWPITWHWIKTYAEEWGCRWILGSGSLVKYWEVPQLGIDDENIPNIVTSEVRGELQKYEAARIDYQEIKGTISVEDLIDIVQKTAGPRLVILNTVANAAVVAMSMAQKYGRDKVEHLSTALTPEDRKMILEKVKHRLENPKDTNWTLVATSCIEAGVDLSFRTGFREFASTASLLQSAGRINRHGIYTQATIWSFGLKSESRLTTNPQNIVTSCILRKFFKKRITISPGLSTQAVKEAICLDESVLCNIESLQIAEKNCDFPMVAENYKIIEDDTVMAVVDKNIAEKIKDGESNWKELQLGSVQIRKNKASKWKLEKIEDNLYIWNLPYDNFLGYMAGILSKTA